VLTAANGIQIDDAQVASLYSQLAGVLAGFAFAALVLVLTKAGDRPRADGSLSHIGDALLLIFGAFLGLVFTSLAYAVMAGDSSGRTSLLHVVAGVGFSIAATTLLLGLSELLADAVPTAARWPQRVATAWTPIIAMAYVYGGVVDLADLREDSVLVTAGWAAVLLVAAAVAARHFLGYRARRLTLSHFAGAGALAPLVASMSIPWLLNNTNASPPPAWPAYLAMTWLVLHMTTVAFIGFDSLAAERETTSRTMLTPQPQPQPQSAGGPEGPPMAHPARASDPPPADIGHSPGDRDAPIADELLRPSTPALTSPELRKRTTDVFETINFTLVSIIQGVALALLLENMVSALRQESGIVSVLVISSSAVFSFISIGVVFYEYSWLSIVLRWTPTPADTFIPLILGSTEILPVFFLDQPQWYWSLMLVFFAAAAAAYCYSRSKCVPDRFLVTQKANGSVAVDPVSATIMRASYNFALRLMCAGAAVALCMALWTIIGENHQRESVSLALLHLVTVGICVTIAGALIRNTEAHLTQIYRRFEVQR
jgi:hypothetical protein